MISLLLVVNVLICVGLIILILLQRSDPASGGMFGGTGGGGGAVVRNPLARPTAILAGLFLFLSLLLAYLNKGSTGHTSIMEGAAPAPATVQEVSATLPAPQPLPATVSPSQQ